MKKQKDVYSGRRGIIEVVEKDGEKIATKRAKDPTKQGAITKEIAILRYLREHKVTFVPQIMTTAAGSFSYPRIVGDHFKDIYAASTPHIQKKLISKLLECCKVLDDHGVVHGELIRPFTNVLVTPTGDIAVIDFERGRLGDRSGKNMRSYAQRLLAEGWIKLADAQHLASLTKDNIYTYLQASLDKSSTTKTHHSSQKNILYFLLTILGLVLFDQVTKRGLYNHAWGAASIWLTPIFNTGIGWSLPVPRTVVLLISSIIIATVYRLWRKNELHFWTSVLIIAGALGNGRDRLILGGVRDFIDLQYRPIFNLADIYLSLAVVYMLYVVLFNNKNNDN